MWRDKERGHADRQRWTCGETKRGDMLTDRDGHVERQRGGHADRQRWTCGETKRGTCGETEMDMWRDKERGHADRQRWTCGETKRGDMLTDRDGHVERQREGTC